MKPVIYAKLNQYRSDIDSVNVAILNKQNQLGLSNFYLSVNDTVLVFQTKGMDSVISVYNKNRRDVFMDDVRNEVSKYKVVRRLLFFKSSSEDFGIDSFKMTMSSEELKKMIADMRNAKFLEE